MQREEARECVGTGCGMAAIASTVKERGHRRSVSNLALRTPAGDRDRLRGGEVGTSR